MSAQQDLEALAALIREHVDAVNAGDLDAVLAQETDDAWYLAPNAPPLFGKESLEEAYRPLYQEYDFEISMTTEDVRLMGDWAYGWGRLSAVGIPKGDADPFHDPDSKYFCLYQKQPDGTWKIAVSAYNSNVPPTPPS